MSQPQSQSQSTFTDLGLHPVLLRGLSQISIATPSDIQRELIPLALRSNQDIVARSRTGTGKTYAYVIPILQRLLTLQDAQPGTPLGTRAVILVPTRELAEQVTAATNTLVAEMGTSQSRMPIRIANASSSAKAHKGSKRKHDASVTDFVLDGDPEIVVATPSRCVEMLQDAKLHLANLAMLVIDESDLILSYGYSSDDIKLILNGPWPISSTLQTLLMSATLTQKVQDLTRLVTKDAHLLNIADSSKDHENLAQYYVRCSEWDKFLLLFVMLKLRLIQGKSLIFVNNVDRGYKLKLFLEKFGIKAGVLNAHLPFNSRYHAVQEFNRGIFRALIATDEVGGLDEDKIDAASQSSLVSSQIQDHDASDALDPAVPSTSSHRRSHKNASSSEAEYGVSRGIDFINVACVVNFDLPLSSRAYIHRVGRTARAGATGTALSFVVPKDLFGTDKSKLDVSIPTAKYDEKVWARIESRLADVGTHASPYTIDKAQLDGFRYRVNDALRSVTRAAIKEARIKELKNELLNSDKLKAHFEDNPRDLAYLQHDRPVHQSHVQAELKHVPSYLMPRITPLNGEAPELDAPAPKKPKYVPFHTKRRKAGGRRNNPLKSGKLGK